MRTLDEAYDYITKFKAISGSKPEFINLDREEYSAICSELGVANLRSNGWPTLVTQWGPVHFRYEPLFDVHLPEPSAGMTTGTEYYTG